MIWTLRQMNENSSFAQEATRKVLANRENSKEAFVGVVVNGQGISSAGRLLSFGGQDCLSLPMSQDTVDGFNAGTLDYCYLNGGYAWDESNENLLQWMPKMKQSGIIAGSGYSQQRLKASVDLCFGIRQLEVVFFGDEWMVDLSSPFLSFEKSRRLQVSIPFRVHAEDNYRISRCGGGERLRVFMAGGLGDVMMATAAMGAFSERHNAPACFDVFGPENLEVFRHLPFVNSVTPWAGSHESMIELLSPGYSDEPGLPNTRYSFAVLDIDDTPPEKRFMRYIVTDTEQKNAKDILVERGWRGERLLVMQSNGGWKCKYWRGLVGLCDMARAAGWFVCWTGTPGRVQVEGYDTPRGEGSLVGVLNLRQLAAVQSLASAWVGHESGGTYLATAVECPSVMLCGAYDGEEMLGYLGGQQGPWRVIRQNWLKKCGRERGLTCRGDQGFPFNDGSGSSCPHRKRIGSDFYNLIGVGADCLDAIRAEDVWEAVKSIARASTEYTPAIPITESPKMEQDACSPFDKNLALPPSFSGILASKYEELFLK